MRKILGYISEYRLFSIAVTATIAGLIFYISGDHSVAKWVVSVVAILETLPLAWDMVRDVRFGRYGIDILAATSIVFAVVLNQYWAAIIVVLMLTGGQALEDYAGQKARSELKALLEKAPQTANLVVKGKIKNVSASEIKVGDKVIVRAGEVVPVDGDIIEGQANFDESSISGESLPLEKSVADQVLSGSISIDGAVTIKTTASAENSQYQQIIKLVRAAANSEAPFVRLADRYSLPFTILAYSIGAVVWVLSGHAIRFLEVIIVATPCPLILAAPVAFISGMARASRYGIIVKTGKSLEQLAESKSIALDKTGTLTTGELNVKGIVAADGFSESDVLKYAYSLELKSSHVLAQSITQKAKQDGVKAVKIKKVQEVAGLGLRANIKGKDVLVGSLNLLKENDIDVPAKLSVTKIDQTAAYVAVDNKFIGLITFIDEIRPDAKATIEHLRSLGIKNVSMITGDNKAVADLIAKKLGIDQVFANALPADKLKILSELKPHPYIFVGDGVNDAPVLTAADVGIALGVKGSTVASESADMVIMLNRLSGVASGLEIAKKTFRIAKQSILIGIALSTLLMLVFASGKFPPLAGALLQEVVDVLVIFNALRAHIITPSVTG